MTHNHREKIGYLPMDSKTVDEDWEASQSCHLTESFEENEDDWGLLVVETGTQAHDDSIGEDVDVGDLVGVKRRHSRVRQRDLITAFGDKLKDAANLKYFKSVEENLKVDGWYHVVF